LIRYETETIKNTLAQFIHNSFLDGSEIGKMTALKIAWRLARVSGTIETGFVQFPINDILSEIHTKNKKTRRSVCKFLYYCDGTVNSMLSSGAREAKNAINTLIEMTTDDDIRSRHIALSISVYILLKSNFRMQIS